MSVTTFNSVSVAAPKFEKYSMPHTNKLTFEMGQLVPCFCQSVLPGERWRISANSLVRFAPLLSPMMSEVDTYIHFFFVPNRIIWSDWETFITGAKDGKSLPDDELPVYPSLNFSGRAIRTSFQYPLKDADGFSQRPAFAPGGILDYFGFQTYNALSDVPDTSYSSSAATLYPVDLMPFAAYQKIWNDYYRDENLYDEWDNPLNGTINGRPIDSIVPYLSNLFNLRHRAWKKDYFTSALPWPQKGDDVLLPLQGSAPIVRTVGSDSQFRIFGSPVFRTEETASGNRPAVANGEHLVARTSNGLSSTDFSIGVDNESHNPAALSTSLLSGLHGYFSDFTNKLEVDLSAATATTIRELRRAYAAQRFLERRAVGGSRYIEQNLSMFGAQSSDGRLQRAQWLGGYRNPVVISQVLQTSESTENSPLAQPAGTAVSAGGDFIFDSKFEEYGYIIGLISVMPRADYITGIPRQFLRRDPYDFYWPQFSRIGEQEIMNQELYFDITNGKNEVNNGTFGYTPRYAEYRYIPNSIHGDFRSSLNFWTLARSFNKTPGLNPEFISCIPSDRVFAVESNDFNHLWCEIAFDVDALRPMPMHPESL